MTNMADVMMKTFCVLLSVFSAVLATPNKVPVLIWTNHESLKDLPGALSGHTYSKAFQTKYIDPIIKSEVTNVVVFIQNKLSLEDFTQYGDVYNEDGNGAAFHNLKNMLEEHKSVNLPAVKNPLQTIDYLKREFKGQLHEWNGIGNADTLSDRNLIIVKLPPRGAGTGVANSLAENDGIIGQVMSALDTKGATYAALLTGEQPSKVESESLYQGLRKGRKLLAEAEVQNSTFINVTDCLYFYTRQINFAAMTPGTEGARPKQAWSVVMPVLSQPSSGSGCGGSNSTSKLVMKWTNPDPDHLTSVTFKMEFRMVGQMWNMSSFLVSYAEKSGGVSGNDIAMRLKRTQTPLGFSYACGEPDAFIGENSTTPGGNYVKINIQGLQLQPFGIKKSQFSTADDCVGFFTIPIWSGLISGFLLTSILFFGITMLLNITTMDRYDDPKGKTITVNTGES